MHVHSVSHMWPGYCCELHPVLRCAGERIALEADGPYHFAANTLAPGGALLARHRLLAARGWAVISVPYYVWNELNDNGRGAWLMQARLLRSSLVASCLISSPVRAPSAGAARSEHMPPHRCGGERPLLCCVARLSGGQAHMVCAAGDRARARGAGGRCSTAARRPAACARLCGAGCHARAAAHVRGCRQRSASCRNRGPEGRWLEEGGCPARRR